MEVRGQHHAPAAAPSGEYTTGSRSMGSWLGPRAPVGNASKKSFSYYAGNGNTSSRLQLTDIAIY